MLVTACIYRKKYIGMKGAFTIISYRVEELLNSRVEIVSTIKIKN